MTAEMQQISPDDPRLTWAGLVSLEYGDGWVRPWRIRHEDRAFFDVRNFLGGATDTAGVRLRLRTDAARIAYLVEGTNLDERPVDLSVDGELLPTQILGKTPTEFAYDNLPAGEKLLELWLPTAAQVRLRGIRLPADASLSGAADTRPRWITYGSSITQCTVARGPAWTWPAVVARSRNLHLTAFGFGGECHLDPLMARQIRDLPAELISIKAGINIMGVGSMGLRAFFPALVGTVRTIRDGHPHTPLVLCSPIYCGPRETTPNAAGVTLVQMREEVARAVEVFRRAGDRNIYYVDGLSLFGPELKHLLPDELHPNAAGYIRLGEHFEREVFGRLGLRPVRG